jgi:hypothetical protein
MINAYRNALDRNVDQFFKAFMERVSLDDLTLVYTSDHGQYFRPGSATHCVASDTKPEMSLVPLYAFSSDSAISATLRLGAERSMARASHFMIAPTLLDWMGFEAAYVNSRHTESLTTGSSMPPSYSRGDIFGLFSSNVSMEPVDLGSDFLERLEETVAVHQANQSGVQ